MIRDFLSDLEGDIAIKAGNMVIGDCWNQESKLITGSSPGDFKNAPLIGPQIIKMIHKKQGAQRIIEALKFHHKIDNKTGIKISINGSILKVDK